MEEKSSFLAKILLFFIFFPLTIHGYDVPLPEEEAATSIFALQAGDEDADVYLEGSWNFNFSGGFGLGYSSTDGFLGAANPSQISSGFQWEQSPDLTLSIWFFDSFFLETSFLDDWDDSTFSMGFVGAEGEFLQQLIIGNTNIEMDNFADLSFSEGANNGLGAAGKLTPENSEHQFMLRFDPTETNSKTYLGDLLIEEETIELEDYIKGQFFVIPDQGITSIQILEKSESSSALTGSDNYSYETVDTDDYSFSSTSGTIYFHETLASRILVYYEGIPSTYILKDSPPSWDSDNSQPIETVIIDGTGYRLLWSPGEFSPFEVARYYKPSTIPSSTSPESLDIDLVEKSQDSSDGTSLQWSTPVDGILSIGPGNDSPGYLNHQYPLHDLVETMFYGPVENTSSPSPEENLTEEIRLQNMTETNSYSLDSPLDGSVKIRINGISEENFSLSSSGVITFVRTILPTDSIVITYQTLSTGTGGNAVGGWGSRFTPIEGLNLEAALGFRWNVYDYGYTTLADQSPGAVIGTVMGSYEKGGLNLDFSGGVSLSNPNTTGLFRLMSMEEGGIILPLSPVNTYPAAPNTTYTNSDRGILYFKNYYTETALGSSYLQDYGVELSDDSIFSYEDGGRTGPYLATALTSDSKSGNILILDAEWEGLNSWVGAQIPMNETDSHGLDLSSYKTVQLPWRWEGDIPSNIKLIVELGTLNEDLDGDNVLDEEASSISPGFTFNDTERNYLLKYGARAEDSGNGYLDSEDGNLNGVLDGENSDQVLTFEINPGDDSYPDNEWDYILLSLTADDRAKLSSVNAIRIRAVQTGTGTNLGKLFVGDLFFEGSPFIPGSSSEEYDIAETFEGLLPAADLPDESLETLYPEVLTQFHPDSEYQRILRFDWDTPSTSWSLKSFLSSVSLDDYSSLSFYIRLPSIVQGSDNNFTITMGDSSEPVLTVDIPLTDQDEWKKLTINYLNSTITLGDDEITGDIDFQPGSGEVQTLTLSMNNSTSGTIYIDEIHLHDPQASFSLGGEANISYEKKGGILDLFGFSLLSDPNISLHLSGNQASYGTIFLENLGGEEIHGQANASIVAAEFPVSASFDAQYLEGEEGWKGEHSIISPKTIPVSISDTYQNGKLSGEEIFYHKNSLTMGLSPLFNFNADTDAAFTSEDLSQNWTAAITSQVPDYYKLNISSSLSMDSSSWVWNPGFYFEDWLNAFDLVLPTDDGDPSSRGGSGEVNLTGDFSAFKPSMVVNTTYLTNLTSETPYENWDVNAYITLPLNLGEGPKSWNLTATYYRNYDISESTSSGGFENDFNFIFDQWDRFLTINSVYPFKELFDFDSTLLSSEGISNSYNPGWSLSYSRSSNSKLINLFLPVSLSLSQNRLIEIDSIEESDVLTSSLKANFSAINLFGRLSRKPVFSFYETEEILTILEVDMTSDVSDIDEILFTLQNHLYFKGRNGSSMTFNNQFLISDQEYWNLFGDLSWNLKGDKANIKLPSSWDTTLMENASLSHIQSMNWEVDFEDETLDSSFLIGHETALSLTIGQIGLFIDFGMDISSDSDEQIYLFGVETGITGKFIF